LKTKYLTGYYMNRSKFKAILAATTLTAFSLMPVFLEAQLLFKKKIPVVAIQPFQNISPAQVNSLAMQLKKVYPHVQVLQSASLPQGSFYAPRTRYRADKIIDVLAKRAASNTIVIGVTSKDISTTKGKHYDWGVMGLGFQPGNACVVSTYRLTKNRLQENLYKVAVHELGHTMGLPHCSITWCYMRDARGGNPLTYEKAFCQECSQFLRGKNWLLPK